MLLDNFISMDTFPCSLPIPSSLKSQDVSLRPLYKLENGTLAALELNFDVPLSSGDARLDTLAKSLGNMHDAFSAETFLCVSLAEPELSDPAFPEALAAACDGLRLDASRICPFFADSLCSTLGFSSLEQLLRFKRLGFRLGIDITNLQALPALLVERLPADVLRLDPLDALAHPADPQSLRDIRDFTRFAANLLMLPAARGVRSQGQLSLLRDVGVRIAQGPVFSDIGAPRHSL